MFKRARIAAQSATRRSTFVRRVQTAVLLAGCLLPGLAGSAETKDPLLAYGARIIGDDARTRIVIDFDREPRFSVHYIANPERIVVDLPATAFGFPANDFAARGLFKDIRYGKMDEESARIVLTTTGPVKLSLAKVQADEAGRGHRLVLDAEMIDKQAFAELVKTQSWDDRAEAARATSAIPAPEKTAPGDFVIAVDAGHGGIDTGAIGVDTKTEEKQVTLAFAKALADRLDKEPGIKAVLTRSDDEFLSLSQRVLIARQNHAGLLISLHADTLKQKDIRGATVYTISDRASDKLAADLAERENLSDQIAGKETVAEPPEVADILLDLTRRETQAFSISLAESVLNSFKDQVGTINNPHRHAGFRVLQAPDVPSILLELGFLSNAEDEKLLLDESWRNRIADLLTEAVKRYRTGVVANGG
ncbi:N-acetylmuramoyl-L-alanine amidase [Rhizobium bangladeshense]|uniref:N-acetylmuramoyl-L-alanine amidase n=1 Tax=Rhizobium bangladeshense TaxID=1138189 RepID=A0ABS7LKA8_9HYPH|nr:N-acetylmuramoyl-L-alanine amidase [Rhizobium bangladeshense]MBX4869600.1 N-acetylmuramoyl-L-alanine amidase [Rhizobium bangladeshense]MBX4874380.1 N-acetylmuramoyl-L-alanine amidase [Rhizobium bangladeshense]MBX4885889.1 N-acetylmuramoyl-L-alanine amidase [Rhizobium bangladeshense]MBX4931564.1 N-acetylmuramoyl-L-alanine amidase [Rhizobium bangladeshense]MBY3582451.1 N-acetylmuramoyl-L-alanine amidase [Rhizobium bangladeshense]